MRKQIHNEQTGRDDSYDFPDAYILSGRVSTLLQEQVREEVISAQAQGRPPVFRLPAGARMHVLDAQSHNNQCRGST